MAENEATEYTEERAAQREAVNRAISNGHIWSLVACFIVGGFAAAVTIILPVVPRFWVVAAALILPALGCEILWNVLNR